MASGERALSPAGKPASGPPSWLTWLGIALGLAAAVALAPGAALLLTVGMSPSLVAIFVDQRSGRLRTHAMVVTNLAGLAPPLMTLWRDGGAFETVRVLLHDVFTWLGIFGAAAGALVLLYLGPSVAASVIAFRRRRMAAQVERAQQALREEWGPSVTASGQPEE